MSELLERTAPERSGSRTTPIEPHDRGFPAWSLTLGFACLALAATLTSSPGVWIADARLEFSTNPVDFLAGHQFFWDDSRGMGNTVTWFSPALAAFQAVASVFVSEIWVIERLVHTLLLTTAATSMVFLVRVLVPRTSWLHFVAGLVYAFNPYTFQFLLPSGLFLSYAISPLLLAAFLRGVSLGGDSWRMAALFALAIFSVGALNTAALVYAGLPMVVALLYLVLVERSTSWAAVGGWVARALLLTIGVSMAALAVLWLQRGDVALNLATTERPEVVSDRSSWAESWRGLGMWLTYYSDSNGPLRPQAAPYFENLWVVLASYAASAAAAVVLVLSRWRPRQFFGALFSLGVLIMVGLWPVDSPSPFGRLLSWFFDNAVLLRGLRTTYKAGAMFYIGVAALAAVAVVWGVRASRPGASDAGRRSWKSYASSTALAGALIVAAVPFWTGGLYNPTDGFDELPEYWSDALDWLNDRPEDGRVLVLPGVVRARYRWGYVNDNLFHGLLEKSLVAHQSIPPPGTPLAADVVRSLDEYIASSSFEPGTLGPILRRLGVRWVLFQNDLEWERLGVGRPASFDEVKTDPALRPVVSFGEIGQNTAAPDDPTARALGEDRLTPVQVYEVVDASDTVRVSPVHPLIVSGGGDSWPQLSAAGLLDAGPIAYSSLMSEADLADAISNGSPVVVTDGARRRAIQVRTGRMEMSHTLGEVEDFYRDPVSPFPLAGQSVTVFADARTIDATAVGRGVLPFDPALRPAMAFDDRPGTAWLVSGAVAEGATLEVVLADRTAVEQIRVAPASRSGGRYARVVRLEVDRVNGATASFVSDVGADMAEAPVTFQVDVPDAIAIRLSLEQLTGQNAAPVGVAEVEVITPDGHLDLREFIQTPRDLQQAAATSPDAANALRDADVGFSFSRYIGSRTADEEVDIRRHYWSPREIRTTLSGNVRLTSQTPSIAVDHLLDGEVGASSPDRAAGFGGWAVNAVDGNPDTSWLGTPAVGSLLVVRPPERTLSTISVVTVVSEGVGAREAAFSTIEGLRLIVGTPTGTEQLDALAGRVTCNGSQADRVCTRTFEVTLPSARYATIGLQVVEVTPRVGIYAARPIAISDVRFDGESNSSDDWGESCVDGLVLDGELVSIRIDGSVEELLAGASVPFDSCTDVVIRARDGSLENVPELAGAISSVLAGQIVASPQPQSASDTVGESIDAVGGATVIERTPTRVVLSVGPRVSGTLIGPGSFHRGWSAVVDGEALGRATQRDAQSSWTLDSSFGTAASERIVTLEFRPQRTYELALAISLGTVALAVAIVIGGRRRRIR